MKFEWVATIKLFDVSDKLIIEYTRTIYAYTLLVAKMEADDEARTQAQTNDRVDYWITSVE